ETQKSSLSHLRPLRRHILDEHLSIDPASWRSLEIDRTTRWGNTEGSLLHSIDRTRTSMGGRLLRQWLRSPLRDIENITARQSAISALLESAPALKAVMQHLDQVCDIERIVARIAVNRAAPRDLAALSRCLASLPLVLDQLQKLQRAEDVTPELLALRAFCAEQAKYLSSAIKSDPAPHLRDGGVIADLFDPELDRLRRVGTSSQQWLAQVQPTLIGESNMPSLAVAHNSTFVYFIER